MEWPRAQQFAPLPEARKARWANFANWETPFFPKFLGLQLEEIRTDYARMRCAYRPELLQPARVWHGGVIASMIDTSVVPAIGSGYDEPREIFTIDMQIRYLAPIPQEVDAVVEGWVVRRGRQIVFLDAAVYTATGDLAATGTLTYKVSSRPSSMP